MIFGGVEVLEIQPCNINCAMIKNKNLFMELKLKTRLNIVNFDSFILIFPLSLVFLAIIQIDLHVQLIKSTTFPGSDPGSP